MNQRHLSPIELIDYMDGNLHPRLFDRIQGHLRSCDICAEALTRSRESLTVTKALSVASAPTDLRQRVLANPALPSITCQEAAPLLQKQFDGYLPTLLGAALERHLGICSACRAEFKTLTATIQAVRSLAPVQPPARVRQAVQAARYATLRPIPWSVRLRPVLATAGLVVAAGIMGLLLHGISYQMPTPPKTGIIMQPVAKAPAVWSVPQAPKNDDKVHSIKVAAAATQTNPSPTKTIGRAEMTLKPVRVAYRRPTREARKTATHPKPVLIAKAKVAIPAALRTLNAVARTASNETGVHLAMLQAGEQFATLSSEAMLSRLPDLRSETTLPQTPSSEVRRKTEGGVDSKLSPSHKTTDRKGGSTASVDIFDHLIGRAPLV